MQFGQIASSRPSQDVGVMWDGQSGLFGRTAYDRVANGVASESRGAKPNGRLSPRPVIKLIGQRLHPFAHNVPFAVSVSNFTSIGPAASMCLHKPADYRRAVDSACTTSLNQMPRLGCACFDPRPNEHQRFRLPGSLLEKYGERKFVKTELLNQASNKRRTAASTIPRSRTVQSPIQV